MRSRLRTQIRSILAARNLDRPELFTQRGSEYLLEVELNPAERFRIDELMNLLETVDERIRASEAELKKFRQEAPDEEKRQHAIALSTPGVGAFTADVILSTLGNVSRFSSQEKVTAYAGLVPGFRESDQKRRDLGITKEGPRLLRWALIQAAWTAVRYSPHWKQVFEKIAARRGRKKASVAVARKLLAVIYSLLQNDQTYVEKRLKPAAGIS